MTTRDKKRIAGIARPRRQAVWLIAAALVLGAAGMAAAPVLQAPQSAVASSEAEAKLTAEQRLAAMTANEIDELRNRKRRFEELPPQKQQRLLELHEEFIAHPRRAELQKTLELYCQWLKTLSSEERAQIRQKSDGDRLAHVRLMRQRQAEEVFGIAGETQLPKEDVSELFAWNREFLASKQSEILQLYRDSSRARNGEGRRMLRGDQARRTDVLFRALNEIEPERAANLITSEDIEKLRQRLSPEAIDIIDNLEDMPARQKLVLRWVLSAVSAQLNPSIPDRELMDFYDTKMTMEQRDLVDSMIPETRRWMIARYYRMYHRERNPFAESDQEVRPGERDRVGDGDEDRRNRKGDVGGRNGDGEGDRSSPNDGGDDRDGGRDGRRDNGPPGEPNRGGFDGGDRGDGWIPGGRRFPDPFFIWPESGWPDRR